MRTLLVPPPLLPPPPPLLPLLLLLPLLPLLSLTSLSAAGDTYCHTAVDKCRNSSECDVKLQLVQQICGTGNYCEPRQGSLQICLHHLLKLPSEEPVFNCYCPVIISPQSEYQRCLKIWKFLQEHPCRDQPPKRPPQASVAMTTVSTPSRAAVTTAAAASPSKSRFLESLNVGGSPPDAGNGESCLQLNRTCSTDAKCQYRVAEFAKFCSASEVSNCVKTQSQCLQAYEALRPYGLFLCTCRQYAADAKVHRQCERVRRYFPGNRCLRYFDDAYHNGLLHSQAGQKGNSGPPGRQRSRVEEQRIQPLNCFNVFLACSKHYSCLQNMLALREACQWRNGRCSDRESCLTQLVAFYRFVDYFSREAATCQCRADDWDCRQQQLVFQPLCAYVPERQQSCLQLAESCIHKKDCYTRFTYYWNTCGESENGCTSQAIQCHRFRRLLLGTDLTQSCNCNRSTDARLLQPDMRDTCNMLRTLLTDPPCLRRHLHLPVIGVASDNVCQQQQRHDLPSSSILRLRANASCTKLCRCTQRSGSQYARCHSTLCDSDLLVESRRCRLAAGGSKRNACVCVHKGELVCSPAVSVAMPPGIYVSVGISQVEAAALTARGVEPPSDWGGALTRLLRRTARVESCPLREVARDAKGAIVRLGSSGVENRHFCLRHLRLVEAMINGRFSSFAVDASVSHARVATVTERKAAASELHDLLAEVDDDAADSGCRQVRGCCRFLLTLLTLLTLLPHL